MLSFVQYLLQVSQFTYNNTKLTLVLTTKGRRLEMKENNGVRLRHLTLVKSKTLQLRESQTK